MAKRPVTMSMRDEDLLKLDDFAGTRRLTRGDAVGVLLEAYGREEPRMASRPADEDPDYIPPPPARLALAKKVLAKMEDYTGTRSVAVEGEEIVEVYPPNEEVEFLKKKAPGYPNASRHLRQEEASQDPGDYE